MSSQWPVVSGQWLVVSGQWPVVSGQWPVVRLTLALALALTLTLTLTQVSIAKRRPPSKNLIPSREMGRGIAMFAMELRAKAELQNILQPRPPSLV